ncbi:hypothetical protein [Alteromonas ponticola]|uniref:DUF4760 domain-containing protein n=1 Tax=Alteromonas ponticola TaxID=2720613 RepID=A0ABX1QZA3_9ALTE|nr:hypothetical protein [Alteromonas ponticola]NMH59539.1 hypothetical protein [Alteromonas ponticola]
MEIKDIIALIVSVTIAVAGWVAAHWLSTRREIEQKKREYRVKHLRDAYIKIANLCDRGEYPRDIHDLQDAFNDIQLFGNEAQITLVGEIITNLTTQKPGDFNELLKQLRNEIREHIGLNSLNSFRWYIRSSIKARQDDRNDR